MIACADDYGLNDDVDRAILELTSSGKLSAVSCMVGLERCTSGALEKLRGFESRIDLGLHLCLTDEKLALSAPSGSSPAQKAPLSFRTLLVRALAGQLDPQLIRTQISAQYELFLEKCGRKPDFIDGHLHVHQFPGVREALLEFVRELPEHSRPFVRNTDLPWQILRENRLPWLKSVLLGVFGARMRGLLEAAGISTNQGFAGIYDFRKWPRYRTYLPRFIACLPDPNGILVVHPGLVDNWRRQEFEALGEFAFPAGTPNRFRR
jgi:predicted glycoside hydrolase/deacetylase ChbG (UPF0249 family)